MRRPLLYPQNKDGIGPPSGLVKPNRLIEAQLVDPGKERLALSLVEGRSLERLEPRDELCPFLPGNALDIDGGNRRDRGLRDRLRRNTERVDAPLERDEILAMRQGRVLPKRQDLLAAQKIGRLISGEVDVEDVIRVGNLLLHVLGHQDIHRALQRRDRR